MSSGETDVTTERLEQAQVEVRVPVTFCGTYRHHVDEKGRVAIPAPLRRFLPDGSVVAPGPDRRLMIWPPDEWAIQKELFRRTAETPAQERRFMRRLTGNSYPFELDAQGRLLLSATTGLSPRSPTWLSSSGSTPASRSPPRKSGTSNPSWTPTSSPRSGTWCTSAARPHLRLRRERPRRIRRAT